MHRQSDARREAEADTERSERVAGTQSSRSGPAGRPPGPDAAFHVLQRIAIYIVISIPNRKSIARGVSHFITISYVYFIVEPKTEAGVQLACVRDHAADR